MWSPEEIEGEYLVSFDFDAFGGKGWGVFTEKRKQAKRFRDMKEALIYWQTISEVQPLRSDGKPNRPLTASTVEIVKLPEEKLP
jgi:hypothetical protein